MQVVLQDAIGNDHENSSQDSVWNTNTTVTYPVKEGTHFTGGGNPQTLGSLSIIRPRFHVLSANLVWLFYNGGRKDREIEGEATFLPGKLLNSSGLTIIETDC